MNNEETLTKAPWQQRAFDDRFPAEADAVPGGWRTGQTVDGRYQVLGVLGRGGMGVVYRVRHLHWNIEMAVKMPLPRLVEQPLARELFIREAQAWVNLGFHPHIVQCFYVREIEGLPRIFAEYVAGGSLKTWITSGRVRPGDWAAILDVAIQACEGLAYAHSKGFVHRDVKPANLLFTVDGRVNVTDFGLVRVLSAVDDTAPMGTPQYSAPEQWTPGTAVDARADVYALGVVLFELCCGSRPFDDGGEPPSVVVARHQSMPAPDPRSVRRDVPDGLADLLLACLAKAPEQRPASATELQQSLEGLHESICAGRWQRKVPADFGLIPAQLNNHAVSQTDLGRGSQALELLTQALSVDPYHPEASYNHGLLSWRQGKLDDLAVVSRLQQLVARHPGSLVPSLLAQIHLERGALPLPAGADLATEVPSGAGAYDHFDLGKGCPVVGLHWGRKLLVTRVGTDLIVSHCDGGQLCRVPQDDHILHGAVTFSSNGESLLIVGYAKIRVIDPTTGACKREVPVPAGSGSTTRAWSMRERRFLPGPAALLNDGRVLLTCNAHAPTTYLLPATGDGWIPHFVGHGEIVTSGMLSPDERFFLTGSHDTTVRIWGVGQGWVRDTLRLGQRVSCVSFTPDLHFLAVGTVEGSVVLFGLAGPGEAYYQEIGRFSVSPEMPRAVGVAQDGGQVAVLNVRRVKQATDLELSRAQLWDFPTRRCLRSFPLKGKDSPRNALHLGDQTLLAMPATCAAIATRIPEHTVAAELAICRPRSSRDLTTVESELARLVSAAREQFGSNPAHAYQLVRKARQHKEFGLDPRIVELMNSLHQRGRRVGVEQTWARNVCHLTPAPITAIAMVDSERAVVGNKLGELELWDLHEGRRLLSFRGHSAAIEHLAVSAGVVASATDAELRVWNLGGGKCVARFGQPGGMLALALDTDQHLVISCHGSRLALWDFEIEELHGNLCLPEQHGDCVGLFMESPGILRTTFKSRVSAQVQLASGQVTVISGIAIQNEVLAQRRGHHIALVSHDGRDLHVLEGHNAPVTQALLALDCRHLVSGDEDGRLFWWELDWELEF